MQTIKNQKLDPVNKNLQTTLPEAKIQVVVKNERTPNIKRKHPSFCIKLPQKTNKMNSPSVQLAHLKLLLYYSSTQLCCLSCSVAKVIPHSTSDVDTFNFNNLPVDQIYK